ncbi:MAG TPA: hypothetical protein DCS17_09135 [Flavobacterium sp.]|nr:hypothetical protein [Flavobacterium sp.]
METTKTEHWNEPLKPREENKRILAGIFALVLGTLGVHKFILGYTKEGIIQLIIGICTCGVAGIISFIEGIIFLFYLQ